MLHVEVGVRPPWDWCAGCHVLRSAFSSRVIEMVIVTGRGMVRGKVRLVVTSLDFSIRAALTTADVRFTSPESPESPESRSR